ncbi:MAG: hypothetical protein EOP06_12230, partial [Proteobacteria bacterium]
MITRNTNSKEKRRWLFVSLLFFACALFLRFAMLDNKPIHFDESINMWFVKRIWEDGFFKYDPTNYHGPLYFYLVQFAQLFTGFDFISTRLVSSVFSFGSVVLLWFGPSQNRTAFRFAALLMLLSPGMGFYGRSGIHEATFVFFQILTFMAVHFLIEKDMRKFWLAAVAGLLGMMALKETFVILILALFPAAGITLWLERKNHSVTEWVTQARRSFEDSKLQATVLIMLLVFVGLYSGFGGNV